MDAPIRFNLNPETNTMFNELCTGTVNFFVSDAGQGLLAIVLALPILIFLFLRDWKKRERFNVISPDRRKFLKQQLEDWIVEGTLKNNLSKEEVVYLYDWVGNSLNLPGLIPNGEGLVRNKKKLGPGQLINRTLIKPKGT